MSVACKWNWHNSGHQVWYDDSTFETLQSTYPLQFYDDFLGSAGGSVFNDTMVWGILEVSITTNATVEIVADSSNGQFLLHCTADNEDQDVVLSHNDNRTFDVSNGLIFETRVNVGVLPTATAQAVFGMCGDHDLDKDALLESAWFKLDGSGAVVVETDDTTNDNDDIATGVTAVPGTYNIYRIDFTTLANVKFFIDGVRVASGTTFDMSNLAAAELILQPYFSIDKMGDVGVGDVNVDYVKILTNRS